MQWVFAPHRRSTCYCFQSVKCCSSGEATEIQIFQSCVLSTVSKSSKMCPLLRYTLWTVLLYNLADMSDIGNVNAVSYTLCITQINVSTHRHTCS